MLAGRAGALQCRTSGAAAQGCGVAQPVQCMDAHWQCSTTSSSTLLCFLSQTAPAQAGQQGRSRLHEYACKHLHDVGFWGVCLQISKKSHWMPRLLQLHSCYIHTSCQLRPWLEQFGSEVQLGQGRSFA